MFLLQQPKAKQIDDFIEVQAQLEFTYSSIGATRSPAPPDSFQVDHNRICLGRGEPFMNRRSGHCRTGSTFG
ncbi:DUF1990 domain-containing protein [Gimesia maris]|uniref:hypothetical protein n=1 Tax=Gimesia maris TaxID=122 RepID=UPI0012D3F264|nr:hypothetical protein [Gimesia maris]QGQ29030.1 hypothetical protein F1729_10430 [Gimesia maris]